MKIAPYYQKLLNLGFQAAKSLEPITFAGMFDSGVDYLFNLAVPLLGAELDKDTASVAVDLSGLTTKEEVETELSFAFSDAIPAIAGSCDYFQLTKHIRRLCSKKKLILVAYLGQDGRADPQFIQFLNRLRNLLGWRFSYVLFVATRLLLHPDYARPLFDKVFKRNLLTVQPLDEKNSNVVLANYEERYSKVLSPVFRRQVLEFAGGNPGLIKALYLQASTSDSWGKLDILDERIYFRLEGIIHDIPESIREMAKKHRLSRTDSAMQPFHHFGYLVVADKTSYRLFSSLLDDFLNIYSKQGPKLKETPIMPNVELLHLTKSQRALLAYLEGRSGELVTKDDIAKVLWGEAWADRYSDWAIDQLVSTLREKMSSIKHDGKIMTKKGEGIIFLPKKVQI